MVTRYNLFQMVLSVMVGSCKYRRSRDGEGGPRLGSVYRTAYSLVDLVHAVQLSCCLNNQGARCLPFRSALSGKAASQYHGFIHQTHQAVRMWLSAGDVCVQTGSSSFPGLQQASETQLPASPVYKDSCEHFSWPLLEPQVPLHTFPAVKPCSLHHVADLFDWWMLPLISWAA